MPAHDLKLKLHRQVISYCVKLILCSVNEVSPWLIKGNSNVPISLSNFRIKPKLILYWIRATTFILFGAFYTYSFPLLAPVVLAFAYMAAVLYFYISLVPHSFNKQPKENLDGKTISTASSDVSSASSTYSLYNMSETQLHALKSVYSTSRSWHKHFKSI